MCDGHSFPLARSTTSITPQTFPAPTGASARGSLIEGKMHAKLTNGAVMYIAGETEGLASSVGVQNGALALTMPPCCGAARRQQQTPFRQRRAGRHNSTPPSECFRPNLDRWQKET